MVRQMFTGRSLKKPLSLGCSHSATLSPKLPISCPVNHQASGRALRGTHWGRDPSARGAPDGTIVTEGHRGFWPAVSFFVLFLLLVPADAPDSGADRKAEPLL